MTASKARQPGAKKWYVSGTVQGVGFRYFVRNTAQSLNLTGYAKNLSDGRVEVYAAGPAEQLNDLAAALHKGPPMSDVRSVQEQDAAPESYSQLSRALMAAIAPESYILKVRPKLECPGSSTACSSLSWPLPAPLETSWTLLNPEGRRRGPTSNRRPFSFPL